MAWTALANVIRPRNGFGKKIKLSGLNIVGECEVCRLEKLRKNHEKREKQLLKSSFYFRPSYQFEFAIAMVMLQ